MSAYNYAFTLTPGRSSRFRSVAFACVAITAVCVLSSTVVMRELVGSPQARAATATPATPAAATTTRTTAATWALEHRWWQGETRQTLRPAATAVPDSELTFTKGYQLRLAARQAQQVAQPASVPAPVAVAAGPSVESQSGRTATAARKSTIARTETPIVQRVSATRNDPPADPFARFDVGSRALAYDEQRPSARNLVQYRPAAPSRGLFGTLY